MDDIPKRQPGGWPAASELDEWAAVLQLHPDVAADAEVSDADRALAAWVKRVALAAALELFRREPEGGRAGRSLLVR